tara:strand:+ start:74 stop:658 length:585 start_codon:yes stop_codon:yes gene_type:complete
MSDVPVVLSCDGCGSEAAEETVLQFGQRFKQPGHCVTQVNLWSPATNTCQHCVAKPAFCTVKLSDLESATLSRSEITKQAVFWAMYCCELNCMKHVSDTFAGKLNVNGLLFQMGALISQRYADAHGTSANMELAGRLKFVLQTMDKIPQHLPTRSKMSVECVDGMTDYSLTTILCLFELAKKREEDAGQGYESA